MVKLFSIIKNKMLCFELSLNCINTTYTHAIFCPKVFLLVCVSVCACVCMRMCVSMCVFLSHLEGLQHIKITQCISLPCVYNISCSISVCHGSWLLLLPNLGFFVITTSFNGWGGLPSPPFLIKTAKAIKSFDRALILEIHGPKPLSHKQCFSWCIALTCRKKQHDLNEH